MAETQPSVAPSTHAVAPPSGPTYEAAPPDQPVPRPTVRIADSAPLPQPPTAAVPLAATSTQYVHGLRAPRVDVDTHRQSGVYPINPRALKVHPRGFKVLTKTSPIERSLVTYFRLPSLPTRRHQEEGEQVEKMMRFVNSGRPKEAVLDGFTLLDACKVEDPEDGIEAILNDANLCKVIPEDLAFFTKLEFLDLGENQIQFAHLSALTALQELHLHCNQLTHIHCPAAAFQELETLNLSYNQLDGSVFMELAKLPVLQRVDLSCNGIAALPSDLSFLKGLTQLALENNELSRESTFHALGSIPGLLEVNLNYNKLRCVPRVRPGGFPNLEVIGLAANKFEFFEDLYTLTEYPNLRRVVLWGNNIQHRRKDLDILNYELYQLDIALIVEGPLPPKRKVGEFYTVNAGKMVKVKEWRKKLRPHKMDVRAPKPPAPQPKPEESTENSFFITGTGHVDEEDHGRSDAATAGTGLLPDKGPGARSAARGSARVPHQNPAGQRNRPVGYFSMGGFPDEDDAGLAPTDSHVSTELSAGLPGDFSHALLDGESELEGGRTAEAADPVEGLELAIPPVTTTKIRTIHRRQHKPGNIRSAIRELKHLLQQAPAPELGRKPSFMERREREPRAAAHGRTV